MYKDLSSGSKFEIQTVVCSKQNTLCKHKFLDS